MGQPSSPFNLRGPPAERPAETEQIDDSQISAAYTLLLQQPGLDLPAFAAELGCSTDGVRAILDRLTTLALLRRGPNDQGGLEAVSPIIAMQQLITREQFFLSERHQFLQQSHDTFFSILKSYSPGADGEASPPITEQLVDLPAIRRRLEELAVYAKAEVLSFSPVAYNPTVTRAASRPLDLAALRRGVRMQTLYLDTLAFEPAALEYARDLVAAGAEVRLVPSLPMRLIVVDRTTAVAPSDPADATAGALIIRHPGLLMALRALFDVYWQQGRALPMIGDARADSTVAERAVLRLLATGAKDEAVARQLGISVRTMRRTVADLMVRAKVDSRFALGVYAAANWL